MPLTASSFLSPHGEIKASLYPGENCLALTVAWLADATSRSTNEDAQAAWVYHRAYRDIANRLNASLASERRGDRAAARIQGQFDYWDARASDALATFNQLTGKKGRPPAFSVSVETEPTW